jgi:hypothetical protein
MVTPVDYPTRVVAGAFPMVALKAFTLLVTVCVNWSRNRAATLDVLTHADVDNSQMSAERGRRLAGKRVGQSRVM